MDKFRKSLLLSIKIGIGCSAAVYLAQHLQLDYAASAGTITLLTVMTSKWESLRLAGLRIVTFLQTVVLAWAVFTFIPNPWVAYGILLATVVFIAEISGWRATTSVNAVIAAHLLSDKNLDHAVEHFACRHRRLIAVRRTVMEKPRCPEIGRASCRERV